MTTQIARDPFARTSLMRDKADPGPCSNCGQKGRRWRYFWEKDDTFFRRDADHAKRAFCSVGCFRSYWG